MICCEEGRDSIRVRRCAVMSNDRPERVEQCSDALVALRGRELFPQRDDATGQPAGPDDHDLAINAAAGLMNDSWMLMPLGACGFVPCCGNSESAPWD